MTARAAGVLYLSVAATGGFSMLFVPSLIVPGDPAATVESIVANESLFRLGVLSGLLSQVLFVFLVLALYRLFKGVHDTYAAVMVALVVVAVPVAFHNMLNHLAALEVIGGADYLSAFDADQLNALVMLFLDLHGQGLLLAELFWGLWLLPLAMLVLKARFAPGWLGVLLIVGFFGYLIDFLARLLFPDHAAMVSAIAGASKFGELAMILWLLTTSATSVGERQAASAEAGS